LAASLEDPGIRALLGFSTDPEAKAEDKAVEAELSHSEELRTEIQKLREENQELRVRIAALEFAQDELEEYIKAILVGTSNLSAPPRGAKTIARIAKIDEILKARGSTSLKELGRVLDIRPQEMSRLVARLDKRRYEIFPRAGKKSEKVLRLRTQIRG
jgi:DNA-binding Lrp family transcriptional regulator